MNTTDNETVIEQARQKAMALLKSQRNDRGFWEGHLSSSALSTAVAVIALSKFDHSKNKNLIDHGILWISNTINDDGGWGDTTVSSSNLSTTLLCWSALNTITATDEIQTTVNRAEAYICTRTKSLEPEAIAAAILELYGDDQTFSVPILTACAIAGRLGDDDPWQFVPQLPFECAIVPESMFKAMNLTVVSYALPALISIGLVRHRNAPSRNLFKRIFRGFVSNKLLKKLETKQPENGGFLEATPLTSFVLMSLVQADEQSGIVAQRAAEFLISSVREDGSWPIDTNLATWVTTLSIKALGKELDDTQSVKDWLIKQQYTQTHPFTNTPPGGWAWTDLPGGVPDADDTSGALLALKQLTDSQHDSVAIESAVSWLINLQNIDGGIPTFCKGWGKLPFDKSCPDITAHAMHALAAWSADLPDDLKHRVQIFMKNATDYLRHSQQSDGSWNPLWFGNEHAPQHANPVYGTALVVKALSKLREYGFDNGSHLIEGGLAFLYTVQNDDHGWGGARGVNSSIEETALACQAFISAGRADKVSSSLIYLADKVNAEEFKDYQAKPIGLYFASLWYYETLYPLVFACSALNDYHYSKTNSQG